MSTLKQKKEAFKEMIKVLELVQDEQGTPLVIPNDADENYFDENISEALQYRKPDDKFSKETQAVIDFYENPKSESKKGEDPIEADNNDLIDEIRDTNKVKDLLVIVNDEPKIFGKFTDNLEQITDVEALQNAMISVVLKGELGENNDQPEKEIKQAEEKKNVKESKPVKEKPVKELKVAKEEVKEQKQSERKNKTVAPSENYEHVTEMNVDDIVIIKPFNSLFDIKDDVLEAITKDMKQNGFDPAYPVVLWVDVLIDGNTRLKAAKAAGLKTIPVSQKDFETEKEALEYAIHNQRNRRNITEAELLRCIEILDKPSSKSEAGSKGGKAKGSSNLEIKNASEPSHKRTARVLGIGESKVSEARTVLKDKKAKEAVISGKKSIHTAAKEVKETKAVKEKHEKQVEPSSSRVQCIIETLKKWSGKKIIIQTIVEDSDILFEEVGGKSSMKESKTTVSTVLEVLKCLELVELLPDDNIKVSKF